jgi:hypothetical protein
VDRAGFVYLAGGTGLGESAITAQIGSGGQSDVYIAKFDASLSELIYAARIGGSRTDAAQALAVDADGAVYVAGYTDSTDFPVTEQAWLPRARFLGTSFVVKLHPEGRDLAYSTYFPTSDVRAITVDPEGRAWVAGADAYGLLPTTDDAPQREKRGGICLISRNGTQFGCTDGFVARLDSTGSQLEYATYLGGTGPPFFEGSFGMGSDRINTLAIGAGGAVFAAGVTGSRDFPVTEDAMKKELDSVDGFLVRLDPSGRHIEYATLLGGVSGESIEHLAIDAAGQPHVLGAIGGAGGMSSSSGIFLVGVQRLFLARLSESGTNVEYWREIPPIAGSVLETGLGLGPTGEIHYSRRAFSDATSVTELGKLRAEGSTVGTSLLPNAGARLALGPDGGVYLAGAAQRPPDGSLPSVQFFGDGPGGVLLVKLTGD